MGNPQASPEGAPARPPFWRALFTERDNATFDLKRVLWALGFVWGLGLETWSVVQDHRVFELPTFALGMSGLLAAGGATLAMNRKNENGVRDDA